MCQALLPTVKTFMNQAESLRQGTSGLGETQIRVQGTPRTNIGEGQVTWPEEITGSFLAEVAWRRVLKRVVSWTGRTQKRQNSTTKWEFSWSGALWCLLPGAGEVAKAGTGNISRDQIAKGCC